MASTAPSHSFVRLTSPEEGNWLSLGRALTTVLCQSIRPYIRREVAIFYNNVTAAITALPAGPCTCVYDPRRKRNQYHDMTTCAWAQLLVHLGNKPNWKQSDPTKWMDPNIGPWEIAKLFIPDIGGHTVIESAVDMDITAILNLMYWCNHFTVQRVLINDVRETRNTKWVHVPKLELSDAEKRAAFETIEKLLQDPVFIGDPDAQDALQDVLDLKCTSDVHIFKAEVLSQFKEAIRSDVSSLKSELKSMKEESEKNKKQLICCVEGRLRNLQKDLEKVEKKSAISASSLTSFFVLSMTVITFLIKSARCIRRKSLEYCLTVLLLCCLVGILDHRSYRYEYETIGCYRDRENRAIQSLEGTDSVLDGKYQSRENPIAKCAVAAMRAGYSMFAVQNGGWCAASATAAQTFDKHGKYTACKDDGEGGPWANQVYLIKGLCRHLKFDTPVDGFALEGHVIKNISLSVGLRDTCKNLCTMEHTCLSVNMGPPMNDKVLCQLSVSDHMRHPGDMKQNEGFTYRGTKNPCFSNPCYNGGTCLNGFTDKKYLCVCQTGTTGENCETALTACKDHFDNGGSHDNKAYPLKLGSVVLPVYCHMTDDLGACGSGGWTLVMKIDGNQQTFHYDSNLWSNNETFNLEGGETGLDTQETKLPTYWNTAFSKICLGMKIGQQINFIVINKHASSLYSVIADGNYRYTSLGRNTWKTVIGSQASLQPYCNKEGFNAICSDSDYSKARIGITANEGNNCGNCDSRIGFGTGGYHDNSSSCGNNAKHKGDNGDQNIKAMGYIFIQ